MTANPRWFKRLERSIAEAPIQVSIAAVFPLLQAAKAHERLARGKILGRILLRVHRA